MGGYMKTAITDKWATPPHIIHDVIAKYGPIDLDPAADEGNAVAPRFYDIEMNGLEQPWNANLVFVNPPYGRVLLDWTKKALEEYDSGRSKKIVMLYPSRTCTRWFHLLYERTDVTIRFIKGRLKYGDGSSPAPFPSILIIIGEVNE